MARYESGERKKIGNKVLAPLNQAITVLPMTPLPSGATNISIIPVASGVRNIYIPKDNELFPIGSLVAGETSSSNLDYIPVSTTVETQIPISSYPKLENMLPRGYSELTYYVGTNPNFPPYTWVCITPTKFISFHYLYNIITIFDKTSFPNSPTTKASPTPINGIIISAFGNNILSALSVGTNSGIYSSDLNTFTAFSFPITGQYQKLIFNGTVFCATTYVGSVSYAYTSNNGTTYTQTKNFGNLGEMLLAASPNGLICAVQKTGTKVFISSDNGENFIEYSLPISNTWNGLVWNFTNNQFALIGNTYSCVSTHGQTWVASSHSSISFPSAASSLAGLFFFYNLQLWMGKTIPLYTRATTNQMASNFVNIDIKAESNDILYSYILGNYSYIGKITFSNNLAVFPIAPPAGQQYFLKGK